MQLAILALIHTHAPLGNLDTLFKDAISFNHDHHIAEGFGEILACGDGEELFGDSGCGEILYAQGSVDLMTLFASFASGNGGDSE